MKLWLGLGILIATTGQFGPAVAGSYVYTAIDVPGQTGTVVTGLDDNGTVAGYYSDSVGTIHGFSWKAGAFTYFGAPESTISSKPVGISNRDTVIGTFLQSNGVVRSFKRKADGAEQKLPLQLPANSDEYATGISSNNTSVGYYLTPGLPQYGFMYRGGVTTILIPPGSSSSGAFGINNAGDVEGTYSIPHDIYVHGFLYNGDAYTNIDPPGSVGTFPYGVTTTGDVYGGFKTVFNSFSLTGFIFKSGTFSTYNYPDPTTTSTVIRGALSNAEFVGTWQVGFTTLNGFHYLNGKFYNILPPGASPGDVYVYYINKQKTLAGIYYVGNGTHPYGYVGVCPADQVPCTQ